MHGMNMGQRPCQSTTPTPSTAKARSLSTSLSSLPMPTSSCQAQPCSSSSWRASLPTAHGSPSVPATSRRKQSRRPYAVLSQLPSSLVRINGFLRSPEAHSPGSRYRSTAFILVWVQDVSVPAHRCRRARCVDGLAAMFFALCTLLLFDDPTR